MFRHVKNPTSKFIDERRTNENKRIYWNRRLFVYIFVRPSVFIHNKLVICKHTPYNIRFYLIFFTMAAMPKPKSDLYHSIEYFVQFHSVISLQFYPRAILCEKNVFFFFAMAIEKLLNLTTKPCVQTRESI